MTDVQVDLHDTDDLRRRLVDAAVAYAEHGWPVLPGSAWNGRRFVVPGTTQRTDGIRPLLGRNLATSDVGTVRSWWNVDSRPVPSVLLRSGERFQLVSMVSELTDRVIGTDEFRGAPGPVIRSIGDSHAFFLVEANQRLPRVPGLAPGDALAYPPGDWVAAPPTCIGNDSCLEWLHSPEFADWRPVAASILTAALTVACSTAED
jgi:hypothetical protein